MRRVRRVGDAALLAEVAGPAEARALAAAVQGSVAGLLDVVPGLASVLATLDPWTPELPARRAELEERLGHLPEVAADRTAGLEGGPATVVIPVVFDGADLDEVARLGGYAGADRLVEALVGCELRVELLGFSPGFGYLSGLPEGLRTIPRLAAPRKSVPAGSVAAAGGFAAVYPHSTPGGWRLLGHTTRRLFDPATPPYAVLRPGDAVRFVRADPAPDPELCPDRPRVSLEVPAGSEAALVVERPGLLTTVQDAGRSGAASLGVPRAGPVDRVRHALANRLVGNPDGAPALELTAEGPVLRALRPLFVAVTGDAPVTLDGRQVPGGSALPVAAGQQLAVGRVASGLRCYLGVRGGLVVQEAVGSASSDRLCGLGIGPLRAGDRLAVGPDDMAPLAQGSPAAVGPIGGHLRSDPPAAPRPDWRNRGEARPHLVRLLPGPHREWFPPDALVRLGAVELEVGSSGDRVGIRLHRVGETSSAVVDRAVGELAPQGMATGALQIPPNGQPVVLLADHATVGGYPVLAVVISADLGVVGQCRPGDRIRFSLVDLAEADRALAELRRWMRSAVVGHYPRQAG